MKHELKKKLYIDPGSQGRPDWYPYPPKDNDLLFFIQRNQNHNTIIYRVNRNGDGLINEHLPMDAYWIKYSEGGNRTELNEIQNRLAYGYDSIKISNDLFKFRFVSYKEMDFYIVRTAGDFKVLFQRDGRNIVLNHIYVYALEFGVFPDVKYVEFFGEDFNTGESEYLKLTVEK